MSAEAALEREGAVHLAGAALPELLALAERLPPDRAGLRLFGLPELPRLLGPDAVIGGIATRFLGAEARAVRAVLFDKSPGANWSLGWHQDRTVVVQTCIDTPGFGPWAVKQGLQHVAPPFSLLARMLTLRIHLDDVPATNAPLLIAPGSHRLGEVPEPQVPAAVERCGVRACLAVAGDVWVYATPILHASDAAAQPQRRRVLQVDFAAEDLPGGLQWAGV